jgi:beta-1,4-mannosyltransferase
VSVLQLFSRLYPTLSPVLCDFLPPSDPPETSPLTELAKNRRLSGGSALSPVDATAPRWRVDRPTLVVSSTSWTPDEDFELLLDALSAYERAVKAEIRGGRDRRRKVWVVISGKGPMREAFEREADRRRVAEGWASVGVGCVWLAVDDYPVLLGAWPPLPPSAVAALPF